MQKNPILPLLLSILVFEVSSATLSVLGVGSFVSFIQETNCFLFPFLQLPGRNGFSRQRELIAEVGSRTVTCVVPGSTQVLGR